MSQLTIRKAKTVSKAVSLSKQKPHQPSTGHYTKRLRATQPSSGLLRQPKAGRSTGQIIQGLRDQFGVNQTMMVRLSGYSPRSIISWAKGTKASKPAAIKFNELHRLFAALADLTQNAAEVTTWLETPNEAFDGSSPLQVIERGESDRLWSMIYYLRSGDPS